ncbi:hypothetical protein Sjap_010790 [Stephania japonica]|uniref:Uncharacterized protein n=1 Tax=Stephania japonica TaxID=461633 RepID=A0AAP0JA91_9MAGN
MFVLSTSNHFFYLSFTSNLHACSSDSSTRILRKASMTPLLTLFVSSNAYSSGISSISGMIQEVLDRHLGMWEKYCVHSCFVIPKGFSLPKVVS